MTCGRGLFQAATQFKPIHLRHHHVAHHQVGYIQLCQLQSHLPIRGCKHAITRCKQCANHLANVVVVVGEEDGGLMWVVVFFEDGLQLRIFGLCRGMHWGRDKCLWLDRQRLIGGRYRSLGLRFEWQTYGKHRWTLVFAANADVATMHVYKGLSQGQADARALFAVLRLVKTFEDMRQIPLGDTFARVHNT